ncbi:hypothetical protein BRC97_11960 [Halobacteriales archaeon QS_6_71_20]|nr:MAG: hypothetical protein BRC97_11960 [Halobacteriales archaeon QS_6_71_20]
MIARALLLVAVVLAGCAAPTAPANAPPEASDAGAGSSEVTPAATTGADAPDSTPESTPEGGESAEPGPSALADDYEVAVAGGDLPVEYPVVFARVAVMLDRPGVEPPSRVTVRPNDRMSVGGREFPEFYRLLGISVPEDRDSALTAAAYVASPERVSVNEAILNDSAETESTLAHESVHVVQFRVGTFDELRGTAAAPPGSSARRLLRTAIVEGSATYVQGEYRERYVPEAEPPARSLAAAARNRSAAAKLGIAPYVAGARYVDARVDDPSAVREVYAEPPRTAEELLHGLPPGSEPVASLSVADADGDGWTANPRSRDTHGELFVRVVLRTQLNRSTAATAAAGWGNDARVGFENETAEGTERVGHAWALRFDDAANATAFRAAAADWAAARDSDASTVRAERVSEETVVLLLGDEAFVGNASVDGGDGEVTVRVDGDG